MIFALLLAAHIDTAGIDKTIAPGDDFFAYANGAWIRNTPIPEDKSSFGTDAILQDEARKRTAELIQNPGTSAEAKKVGDYYAAYLDEAGIEKRGLAPLQPELDAIAAIADARGLARALGQTLRADTDPLNDTNFQTDNLFGLWVAQGLDDPQHNVPYLMQGGLELPERDYYLST